jgi:hypothetical protein
MPDDPALPEALVISRDAADYRAVLMRWHRDAAERRAVGARAKSIVESHHCGPRWREQLEAVYRRAASGSAATQAADRGPTTHDAYDLALASALSRAAIDAYFARSLIDRSRPLPILASIRMAAVFGLAMRGDLPRDVIRLMSRRLARVGRREPSRSLG